MARPGKARRIIMALETINVDRVAGLAKAIYVVAASDTEGFVYHIGQDKTDARAALRKLRGIGILYVYHCGSFETL